VVVVIGLLAATLVAVWPSDADVAQVCLRADGETVACASADLVFEGTWFTADSEADYDAVAIDAFGNESAPSNVVALNDTGDLDADGDVDLLDMVILRRRLAGLDP